MSPHGRKLAMFALSILFTGQGGLAISPASASKPVPKVIVGCVVNGAFISSDGYHIFPRYRDGREVDLREFEGYKTTIEGVLLPGDRFILNKPPRASGRCGAK